jgi:hypothetical protein
MMPKYRKKPVVIEAVQLNWSTWNEICDFAGVGKLTDGKPQGCCLDEKNQPLPDGKCSEIIGLLVPTLEGLHIARQGDYIIKGIKGELYPCKPDIFEATYEPVEEKGD